MNNTQDQSSSAFTGDRTVFEYVCALPEGNPGALRVCMSLMAMHERVDPLDWRRGLAPLINFDEYGLKGSSIWILFKDICKEDEVAVTMLFRAVQLGEFSKERLLACIQAADSGTAHELSVQVIVELYTKVKDRLKVFDVLEEFCLK